MSPAPLHGSKAGILLNGYDLSPFHNTLTDGMTVDVNDETCFGPLGTPVVAKSFIPGLEDCTVDAQGKYAIDHAVGAPNKDQVADVIETAVANRNASDSVLTWFPFGDGFGNNCRGMLVKTTTWDVTSPVSGIITCQSKFQSKVGGELLNVLHVLQSEAATANGATLDAGAAYNSTKWKGLTAYLHVTAQTATNNVCKVQHSTDGVTWVDLATFTAVTAPHKAQRITVLGTINRYLRAQWTLTGGAATFHVAAGRIPA